MEIEKKQTPIITLVGRVNVGKSTLFNCLLERKKAITSNIAGTTRDRNYGYCLWRGKKLKIVDTGGFININKKDQSIGQIEKQILAQIKMGIMEGDLIIFILEANATLSSEEYEIAKLLRQEKKPIILVINKVDNPQTRKNINPEIFKFGFEKIFYISAANGVGVGDLLDEIIKQLKTPDQKKANDEPAIKVSIVGRPNVGKSSILNALLGEPQVIVSEVPHTTRGPQDMLINFQDKNILIVDTAGIRRKPKIESALEKIGVDLSLKSMKESDITLFVLEAQESVSHQDRRLAQLTEQAQKSVIFLINKSDLVEKSRLNQQVKDYFLSFFPQLKFCPLLFISAKTGYNIEKILPLVIEIEKQRHQIVEQAMLDKILAQMKREFIFKTKSPALRTLTQDPSRYYPYFNLTLKRKELLPAAFTNILEKKIRQQFNFLGTPIRINLNVIKK